MARRPPLASHHPQNSCSKQRGSGSKQKIAEMPSQGTAARTSTWLDRLPIDSRTASTDQLLDLLQRGHRCVARRRHGQRAVRCAVLHGILGGLAAQEAVDEARGEAVAAADSV